MDSITLHKKHLPILTDEKLKDEFVAGVISILQGEEAKASTGKMALVFGSLVYQKKLNIIHGIPRFDPKGMKESELDRYNQVQAGKVPSSGLEHSYADLQFKPITTLDREYLSMLYSDCQDRINRKGSAEYRRFISYLTEMMKHCAGSGEL